ncbi:BDH1 [Symbiodinium natans]|uniref:BDH1 protein n=1 Tax=Symbiodinium natans TaxID=878477 RepID=A0A812QP13_9DINO|nr:BDH1 [Symbiodinium natans]
MAFRCGSSQVPWCPSMQQCIMAILAVLILGVAATSASGLTGSNRSVCVSKKGLLYDEAACDKLGRDRGCAWEAGQCICRDGGRYSKKARRCAPPQTPTSTGSTKTTLLQAPLQDSNGSTCVSNRGLPYDEYHCGEVARSRGCIWKDNRCACENGGVYSKSGHKCWPPTPPATQVALSTTTEPPPLQEDNSSVCVSYLANS